MQLSVIIVNYDVKYFLEQCLCSVQKAIQQIEAEILVVDNASSDGSFEYLAPAFPTVIFINNRENTGYARANNQGLRLASGKYILFLNPDTIIPGNCLKSCISLMESDPLSGALGIRMLDGSGQYLPESKRGFPSLRVSFFKLSGLTALFPRSRWFAAYYLGHLSEKQDQECDVLAGAFYFASKAVLEETGGFDEQFFMYGEDIDLSYRIRQAGKKLHYLANPPIIHFKGESTKKASLQYLRLFYKAMGQFVRKHYSGYASGWFTALVEVSIWFRASIAAAGNLFRKGPRAYPSQTLITLVLGSAEELQEVTAILKRHSFPFRQLSHLKDPAELPQAIRIRPPDEIIFCEGSLSYHQIIGLMENAAKKTSFWIHSAGTHSIVGSAVKYSAGNALG